MYNTDNLIDLDTLTTDSMFKLIANFLLTSIRLKEVANIGIFYEGPSEISIDRVLSADLEDLERDTSRCIYVIDTSFITLPELNKIAPRSLEQVSLASFYDRLANSFPELEEVVELAIEFIQNNMDAIQEAPFIY